MSETLAEYAREEYPCECGHKHISHGSFDPAGEFLGIGGGMCGMENGAHDRCPCNRYRPARIR